MVLIPEGTSGEGVAVRDKDIVLILLKNQKTQEIEIQTANRIFRCALVEKNGFDNLLIMLKDRLKAKIVCEYEGGQEDA
jgi:hypothetical protein